MFVYRTIDDVAALRGWVEEKRRDATTEGGWERPVRGAVIGGGLLGLEAAGALKALGAQATVVQFGTHLMDAQIDLGGGEALKRLINGMGIAVRCDTGTKEMRVSRKTGHVGRLDFADGGRLDVDVVVLATGVRPRDELARAAGLAVGERGARSSTWRAARRTSTCGPWARSRASRVAASASSRRATPWRRSSRTACSAARRRSPARTPRRSSSSRGRRRELR